MIKKTVTAIVAVLLAVAFISCDSGGGGDDGYSAPSVMSIEDLPASSATVFPDSGTEQKAIDLFANAIKALSNEVDLDTDYELDGDTITYSIDETAQDDNGGLLTYKGFAESASKYSYDDNFTPELNKTYKDFITTKTTVELDTEVNNYTLEYSDYSDYESITLHIRGGESKERMKSSTDFTLTIGSSTSEIDFEFDFSVSIAYSAAYSMTDEDGFGGKFIVQFSEDFKDSVDLESLYDDGEDAIYDELASTEATLEVYNDSNELVLTTKVPASKLMRGSSNF